MHLSRSLVLTLSVLVACTSEDSSPKDATTTDPGSDGGTADGGGDGAADGGTDGGADGGGDGAGDGGADGADGGDPIIAGVVSLETRDGITLAADYAPVGTGGPAVVLLHMIPPAWDRSSWPADFISTLNGEGWTVLNVDRRGAGDSEGRARDAYEGPNGKWDAEAAVSKLVADGFGPIAIIGASNGTTTALDYAVWAAGDGAADGATAPAWVAFMTGGSYTEVQNPVENALSMPILYTYSTAENAWSVAQQAHDTGAWQFREYASGDHGTLMFGTSHSAEITADIVAFGQASFAR